MVSQNGCVSHSPVQRKIYLHPKIIRIDGKLHQTLLWDLQKAKEFPLGHQSKHNDNSSFKCTDVHSLSRILIVEHLLFWGSTYNFTSHCATTKVCKAEGHFVGDLLDADIHFQEIVKLIRLETLTGEHICEPMEKKIFFFIYCISFDIIWDTVFHISHWSSTGCKVFADNL